VDRLVPRREGPVRLGTQARQPRAAHTQEEQCSIQLRVRQEKAVIFYTRGRLAIRSHHPSPRQERMDARHRRSTTDATPLTPLAPGKPLATPGQKRAPQRQQHRSAATILEPRMHIKVKDFGTQRE